MRAIIIEDEPLAAAKLRDSLARVAPSIEVVATTGSVAEAAGIISRVPHDLLFMDIHLVDGSAFDIFKRTQVTAPVIFITAYDEYALKAFDHQGIGYLLKPFGRDDLRRAIDKLGLLTAAPAGRENPVAGGKSAGNGEGNGAGNTSGYIGGNGSGNDGGNDGGIDAGNDAGNDMASGAENAAGIGTAGNYGAYSGGSAGIGVGGGVENGGGNAQVGTVGAVGAVGTVGTVGTTQPIYQERFLVHMGARMKSVATTEVAYFRSEGKYVHLITRDNKDYLTDRRLGEIGEKLPPNLFFRINRRLIIRFESIREMIRYSGSRIKIILDPPLPEGEEALVSTDRVQEFRKWLNR